MRRKAPRAPSKAFQSSPGPGAGCCLEDRQGARVEVVSILTRPGGRVLL